MINRYFYKLHLTLFNSEPSPLMNKFVSSLNWSLLGFMISGLIFFIVNIFAGKYLGPEQYGKYNLIASIGSFVSVFMIFGLDATSIKYVSGTEKKSDKKKVITNILLVTLISSIIIMIILSLFSQQVSSYLKTNRLLVISGGIFGLTIAYKTITDNIIKALHLFKTQSLVKIIESTSAFLFFLFIFMILEKGSYLYYFLIIASASTITIAIYLVKIKPYMKHWDKEAWNSISHYWKLTLITSIIGIIIASIDKFMLSRYLGASQLGLYSAYMLPSTVIIGQLINALINVFFPLINTTDNKIAVLNKINKLAYIGFLPIIITVSIISTIIIRILGPQYQFEFIYVIIISLISFMQIYTSFCSFLIASSNTLYKTSVKIYYLKPIFLIIYIAVLTLNPNYISLFSIFLITILSYSFDLISNKITFSIHLNKSLIP